MRYEVRDAQDASKLLGWIETSGVYTHPGPVNFPYPVYFSIDDPRTLDEKIHNPHPLIGRYATVTLQLRRVGHPKVGPWLAFMCNNPAELRKLRSFKERK